MNNNVTKFPKRIPNWLYQARRFISTHLQSDMYKFRSQEFKQGFAFFCEGNFDNPYNLHSLKNKNFQHGQDCAYLEYQRV